MRFFILLYLNFVFFYCVIESNPVSSSTTTTTDLSKTAVPDTSFVTTGKTLTSKGAASSIIVTELSGTTSTKSTVGLKITTTILRAPNATIVKESISPDNSISEDSEITPSAPQSTTFEYKKVATPERPKYWSKVYKVFFIVLISALSITFLLAILYFVILYGIKASRGGLYQDQYG